MSLATTNIIPLFSYTTVCKFTTPLFIEICNYFWKKNNSLTEKIYVMKERKLNYPVTYELY